MSRNVKKVNFNRIENLRISKGLLSKDLAREAGVSEGAISGLLGGTRGLGIKKVEKLAEFLGVSVESLYERNEKLDRDSIVPVRESATMIPIFAPFRAGNGEHGCAGEIVGEIAITEEQARRGVFAVRISGDSMVDEIFPGEVALFQPINGDGLHPNDICAICIEGWAECTVKYLDYDDPRGIVHLRSANEKYERIPVNPEINKINVLGVFIEARRTKKR